MYHTTGSHQLLAILIDLLLCPSPSGQEELVRAYVVKHLQTCGFTLTVDTAGNVLAVRGTPSPGQGYPLLSFHMDTVEPSLYRSSGKGAALRRGKEESLQHFKKRQQEHEKHIQATWQVLAPSVRSPEALIIEDGWIHTDGERILGGDDKCGGAIALTLASATTMPLKIVASTQEEVGCVGISQVDPDFFADVSYALVLDRREAHDLVTSVFDPLCTDAFGQQMIECAATLGHPVRPVSGMLSDAVVLARYIRDVVNLSVGYYWPHTRNERISIQDVSTAYTWAFHALWTLPLEPTPVTDVPRSCASVPLFSFWEREDTLLLDHSQDEQTQNEQDWDWKDFLDFFGL